MGLFSSRCLHVSCTSCHTPPRACLGPAVFPKLSSHLKYRSLALPSVSLLHACMSPRVTHPLKAPSSSSSGVQFCTIEPNNARVSVPDERFTWLAGNYKPKSQLAAYLDIVDIAGLVRGASTGELPGARHRRIEPGCTRLISTRDSQAPSHVSVSHTLIRKHGPPKVTASNHAPCVHIHGQHTTWLFSGRRRVTQLFGLACF